MGCESLVILSGKVGEKEYKKLYPPYKTAARKKCVQKFAIKVEKSV